MKREVFSPTSAVRRFGFKQTFKGAIIIGVLAGFVAILQGTAFAATFPTAAAKTSFATTVGEAPVLGVIYGEAKNLVSPAGYVVFRVVPFMGIIAAIWGLTTVTKLLREQEEDGRFELIASGSITMRRATQELLIGFSETLILAFLIATIIIAVVGATPTVSLSLSESTLISAAIFLPAVLFAGVGVVTSQLTINRRRATMYGLVIVVIFFGLRAIGNTMGDWYFLKHLTPFGWSDLISPVVDPQLLWLLPFIAFSSLLVAVGVYYSGRRDLGMALINESDVAKSHFFLLGSPSQLALRQNIPSFMGWAVSALAICALIVSVANVAAQATAGSPTLTAIIGKLGGSVNDLTVAYMGAGFIFTLILLLIMTTTSMSAVRNDEAKGYLDAILVRPIHRSSWLIGRLLVIVAAFTAIALMSVFVTWLLATTQNITIDLGTILLVGIALTGTLIFTLGIGTLFYGIAPRFAAIAMYIIIGWSFLIDILRSVMTLDDAVINTSLFHYISVSPTATPNWWTFIWLVTLGVVMAAIGITTFTKRDIIAE